jgi:hypothetical protein
VGADQFAVDEHRAAAHAGGGPADALGEGAEHAKEDEVLDSNDAAAALQKADDFELKFFDRLPLDRGPADPPHPRLDLREAHDGRKALVGAPDQAVRQDHPEGQTQHEQETQKPRHADVLLSLRVSPRRRLQGSKAMGPEKTLRGEEASPLRRDDPIRGGHTTVTWG